MNTQTSSKAALALAALLAAVALPARAAAGELSADLRLEPPDFGSDGGGALAADTLAPELLAGEGEGRLLHGGRGGYHVGGGPREGLLVGIDLGAALPIFVGNNEAAASFAAGGLVGWQFPNGVAVLFRYQDLGLRPDVVANTQWQLATFGMRYTFPYIIPQPFLEALVGLSLVNSNAPLAPGGGNLQISPGGAVGVGLALPLARHVAVEVAARDWLSPIGGDLFQILGLEAGVTVDFGAPPRPH